jgi:hypothetical protein
MLPHRDRDSTAAKTTRTGRAGSYQHAAAEPTPCAVTKAAAHARDVAP